MGHHEETSVEKSENGKLVVYKEKNQMMKNLSIIKYMI